MKNFLVNYRRRFNLDEVLQEWEAEQEMDGGGGGDGGEKEEEEAEKNMEVCSAEEEGAPEEKVKVIIYRIVL